VAVRTFGTITNTRSTRKGASARAPVSAAWPSLAPMAASRYRCTACGNLTRFDVTTTRRTRAFHHFTVGGDLQIEDEEVLSEVTEAVACRWCGTGASVEVLAEEQA